MIVDALLTYQVFVGSGTKRLDHRMLAAHALATCRFVRALGDHRGHVNARMNSRIPSTPTTIPAMAYASMSLRPNRASIDCFLQHSQGLGADDPLRLVETFYQLLKWGRALNC